MAGLRLDRLQPRGLQPLDLALAAGEQAFISGPSGCGKSLLLRAIADLDPHPGEVWLDGVPRSAIPPPDWRRRVGLLPAESHWWGERVGEHFPPDPTAAGTSLDRNGPLVSELLAHLGFDRATLDWTVARLSTGERQRLALARQLAHQPAVLLLDEATANLDPPNQARVEELVADYRIAQGAAVLWVSHDPDQRRRLGGRRLIIAAGRLEVES